MNPIRYALAELGVMRSLVEGVDSGVCEQFVDELQKAKRIFVGGAGRSLLSMKMFAMRLMQTNHETYLVGEVCTPSVRPGDLLVVSSGSGITLGTLELVRKARKNGGRAAVLTMNPTGPIAGEADFVLPVPPPATADTESESAESVFMKRHQKGNYFETVTILVTDGIIAAIMAREGYTDETIMSNHANLE